MGECAQNTNVIVVVTLKVQGGNIFIAKVLLLHRHRVAVVVNVIYILNNNFIKEQVGSRKLLLLLLFTLP